MPLLIQCKTIRLRNKRSSLTVTGERIGQPGEIAPTVLFLASEGASYITGQVIPIDGGKTAQ